MKEFQSKIILFLPRINTVRKTTENKEKTLPIDIKKTLNCERETINTMINTQTQNFRPQISTNENGEFLNKPEREKTLINESSKKKLLNDKFKMRNKDLIKLTQVSLSLNLHQNSSTNTRIFDQAPLLSSGFSSKKFSKDNLFKNNSSVSNLKTNKNIFKFSRGNTKFPSENMKNHNKFYDIKFGVNSPIEKYMAKYNLNTIYPNIHKNNFLKAYKSKSKPYLNQNDNQIDCEELIRNFDEIKETNVVESYVIQTNISNFMISN